MKCAIQINVPCLALCYDTVGITETWLGEEDGDEYNIEGYNVLRREVEV